MHGEKLASIRGGARIPYEDVAAIGLLSLAVVRRCQKWRNKYRGKMAFYQPQPDGGGSLSAPSVKCVMAWRCGDVEINASRRASK